MISEYVKDAIARDDILASMEDSEDRRDREYRDLKRKVEFLANALQDGRKVVMSNSVIIGECGCISAWGRNIFSYHFVNDLCDTLGEETIDALFGPTGWRLHRVHSPHVAKAASQELLRAFRDDTPNYDWLMEAERAEKENVEQACD